MKTAHDHAALLDPDAYTFRYGANWSEIVPSDTVWWAVNLWNIRINGIGRYDHRKLDICEAMPLTPGTIISTGPANGMMLVCKPETVTYPDAEEVLARRYALMRSTPMKSVQVTVPAGSPVGWYDGDPFEPGDYTGLLHHTSSFDVSWTILVGNQTAGQPPGKYDSANTLDELSDAHAVRFSGNTLFPFRRSKWNGIWVKAGSRSGDYMQGSLGGVGCITYQIMPEGW